MKKYLILFVLFVFAVSAYSQKSKVKKEGLTFYKEIDRFENTCKIQSPWIGISCAYKLRFGKDQDDFFLIVSASPFFLKKHNYKIDELQILLDNKELLTISIPEPFNQIKYSKNIKNGRKEVLIFVTIDNKQVVSLSKNIVKGIRAVGSFEYVNEKENRVKNHILFLKYVKYIMENNLCDN